MVNCGILHSRQTTQASLTALPAHLPMLEGHQILQLSRDATCWNCFVGKMRSSDQQCVRQPSSDRHFALWALNFQLWKRSILHLVIGLRLLQLFHFQVIVQKESSQAHSISKALQGRASTIQRKGQAGYYIQYVHASISGNPAAVVMCSNNSGAYRVCAPVMGTCNYSTWYTHCTCSNASTLT